MQVNQPTDDQLQDLWNAEAAEQSPAPVEQEDNIQAVDEQQTQQVLEQTSQAPEVKPADEDPLAGLPEAVKAKLAKIEEIVAANQQLSQDLKTATGRVSALQREFDLAKKAQQQAGGDAPSTAQIAAAGKNSEKWEKLKKEFPDWADGLQELVSMSVQGVQSGVNPQELQRRFDAQLAQTRQELVTQFEVAKIEAKYEDWTDQVKTPEFANWMRMQPPEIQSLAQSDKARDAVRMLDLYNTAKAQPASQIKQERGARLAVAATQKGTGAPPPSKRVEDMTPAELWAYEARRLEKQG